MVTKKTTTQNIPDILRFDPQIIFDPVPWYIIEHLDRNARLKLAQRDIGVQRRMLQARLDAADQLDEIIKGK